MQLLSKLEDFFVQIIRLVLLAFAAVVLISLALLLLNKVLPSKSSTSSETTIAWTDVQPDMQFLVEETGRDMGMEVLDVQLQERLADPQLRLAFQQSDRLLRDFIAQKPAQHALIEHENEARGLAPVHPLLAEGAPAAAAVPGPAVVEVLAEDAVGEPDYESCCWSDPVDLPQMLHERATQLQAEYGEQAYAAFVLGAPQAFAKVLGDASLAPRLHEQTVSRIAHMIVGNYNISFSRAVSQQDSVGDSDNESLWESIFSSIGLTLWSVILSFLVLVVFMVMAIRMEKHLRRISHRE